MRSGQVSTGEQETRGSKKSTRVWISDVSPIRAAIDVDAEHVDTALTRLDDESKSRLARLFARHAAAVWRKKASALSRDSRDQDNEPLSRSSSIRSADAYDSDFSAPPSRYGSPKRDREPTTSPLRTGSSRFGAHETVLNSNMEV